MPQDSAPGTGPAGIRLLSSLGDFCFDNPTVSEAFLKKCGLSERLPFLPGTPAQSAADGAIQVEHSSGSITERSRLELVAT